MEEKVQKEPLALIHQTITYKMVIPNEVERKIRFLCREIHNTEWSGVLFYKVTGSFEDGSLIITCLDIFQMDEGNASYTEYSMSVDLAAYIVDHPELCSNDVYQGLIHSHHCMSTFFSSTDTNTLKEEGSDMNHFVSLIVNNEGTYTAAITKKVTVTQNIKEKYSYNTWENKKVPGTESYTIQKECIQWFNLDIELEKLDNDYEKEMLDRLKDIRQNKKENHFTPMLGHFNYEDYNSKEQLLPLKDNNNSIIDYDSTTIDNDTIDWIVKQTLTCSALISYSRAIDIPKWLENMDALYQKRFGDVQNFEVFASNFADYIINFTELPQLSLNVNEEDIASILAYNINKRLMTLPKSKWLESWIKVYNYYIM